MVNILSIVRGAAQCLHLPCSPLASPPLASRLASPRFVRLVSSPRLASHRLASPRLASPRSLSHLNSPFPPCLLPRDMLPPLDPQPHSTHSCVGRCVERCEWVGERVCWQARTYSLMTRVWNVAWICSLSVVVYIRNVCRGI